MKDLTLFEETLKTLRIDIWDETLHGLSHPDYPGAIISSGLRIGSGGAYRYFDTGDEELKSIAEILEKHYDSDTYYKYMPDKTVDELFFDEIRDDIYAKWEETGQTMSEALDELVNNAYSAHQCVEECGAEYSHIEIIQAPNVQIIVHYDYGNYSVQLSIRSQQEEPYEVSIFNEKKELLFSDDPEFVGDKFSEIDQVEHGV